MLHLASIVEGHGECEAVPILVRRIAQTLDVALTVSVHPVLRVPGSRLAKQGEIERTVELAARKNAGQGAILVLLDCDDGCPTEDAPALLKRATTARPDLHVSVVLAKREYEAWFLAAAESLRGQRGLPTRPGWTAGARSDPRRQGVARQPDAQRPRLLRVIRSTRAHLTIRHERGTPCRLV